MAAQTTLVTGLKTALAKTNAQLAAAKERLADVEGKLQELQAAVADKDAEIAEKDEVIAELETRLAGPTAETSPSGAAGASTEAPRSELYSANYTIQERDTTIKKLRSEAQKSRTQLKKGSKAIASLEQQRLILGGLLVVALLAAGFAWRRKSR